MKISRKKLSALCVGMVLGMGSINAGALDTHATLALDHAQTAAKIGDVKVIAEQLEMAKSHIRVIEAYLKAGNTSLDSAIAHAHQGDANLAKKSAEEAVAHLKAAQ